MEYYGVIKGEDARSLDCSSYRLQSISRAGGCLEAVSRNITGPWRCDDLYGGLPKLGVPFWGSLY